MATQTAIGSGPASDTGGFFQLRNGSTNALVASAAATETASGSTIFTASYTDVAAGTYRLVYVDSTGAVRYVQWIKLLLATGTYIGYEIPESVFGADTNGDGPRTVTITVNDGATALENVNVSLTEGVNVYTSSTNASGVATFNLIDATYTVALYKSGYSYAGTTLVVDGTETVTYSMTSTVVTPGSGDFTTGFLTCYSGTGAVESGVIIYVEMTKIPSGDTGYSYDSIVREITSDVAGLVEIPGLVKGGTYRIWRGKRSDNTYLIPAAAGATYELPSHIGREQ